jgi:hypothetical protein
MAQNRPRRGGPADRRQVPVLTLTALNLRRRRGITASVLADCPVQPATPSSQAAPHTALSRLTQDVVLAPGVRMRKGGIFEKPPVSSVQNRYYEQEDFPFQPP